jgi:Ca2+-binding RTX toxin-like protein
MKRGAILLLATVAALVLASGVALAVTKQCPSGTTETNPCKGTAKSKKASGSDILVGTSGSDYITALSGNDWINGGGGGTEPNPDTTDGGTGNDTYSYRDGFGIDTLKDSSGIDTVNLSAATGGAEISLIPEWQSFGYHRVFKTSSDKVNISSGTVIERAVGTSGSDHVRGGKESNTLKPGPDHPLNDDILVDWGGCSATQCLAPGPLPASNDTYKGFGLGISDIKDYGGSADTLDLSHMSSDEASFEFSGNTLVIYLGGLTSQVRISDYLTSQQFRMEKIVFSDTTVTNVG